MNSKLNTASTISTRSQVAYRRKASEPMTSATPITTESQDGSLEKEAAGLDGDELGDQGQLGS